MFVHMCKKIAALLLLFTLILPVYSPPRFPTPQEQNMLMPLFGRRALGS